MFTVNADPATLLPLMYTLLTKLVAVVGRVAANPTQPVFNHYVFEALAATILGAAAAGGAPGLAHAEGLMFPPLQTV